MKTDREAPLRRSRAIVAPACAGRVLRSCASTLFVLAAVLAFAVPAPAAGLKVGDAIPAISLPDLRGNRVSLPDDARDKVILVHFWATWCPYCVKEITAIDAIYQTYGEKGFAPYSVNVGETRDVIEPYLAKLKANYPVLTDSNADVVKAWGVTGIPTTFICDGNGVIRYKIIGEVNRLGLEKVLGTVFR